MWGDGFLRKAVSGAIANGPGAFNDGFNSGMEDNYGIKASSILGSRNCTTMLLSNVDYPSKGALELGVNNVTEHQTIGYVTGVANAKAEGKIEYKAEMTNGPRKGDTLANNMERIREWTGEVGEHIVSYVENAEGIALDEIKGMFIGEMTNKLTKKGIGEPDGIPRNNGRSNSMDMEARDQLVRPENVLDGDNPVDQLLAVAKKLRFLGMRYR